MKVYTRVGDDGHTALANGERVAKASARVGAYGDVDELNAVVGILRCESDRENAEVLARIQDALFEVGAWLADPRGRFELGADVTQVAWLEGWIDRMEEGLPTLKNFVLPGGSRGAAGAQFARTVCRRAERAVVALSDEDRSASRVIPFLNRLSDAFFVHARALNHQAGVAETIWRGSS